MIFVHVQREREKNRKRALKPKWAGHSGTIYLYPKTEEDKIRLNSKPGSTNFGNLSPNKEAKQNQVKNK